MKKTASQERTTTELIFILDRSGSMSGLEKDTIGGFNSMLERQKKEDNIATVTTVLFDDQYELLHDRIDIRAISPLTDKEYYVGGSTALLDAIGRTIHKIHKVQLSSSDAYRASRVLFIITTDGMENASKEYSSQKIKELIELHTKKDHWEFLFLGANIDAVETAQGFGISADRAVNYCCDSKGTALNYDALNSVVKEFRSSGIIQKKWKSDIEADYQARTKP